jgi:hypothetical protein
MRQIMKAAVDHLFTFLVLKQHDQEAYEALLKLGERYTTTWDDPIIVKGFGADSGVSTLNQ